MIWKGSASKGSAGTSSGGGGEHVFIVPDLPASSKLNEEKRRAHRLFATARVTKWSKTSQQRIALFRKRSAQTILEIMARHHGDMVQRAWDTWMDLVGKLREIDKEKDHVAKLLRSKEAHKVRRPSFRRFCFGRSLACAVNQRSIARLADSLRVACTRPAFVVPGAPSPSGAGTSRDPNWCDSHFCVTTSRDATSPPSPRWRMIGARMRARVSSSPSGPGGRLDACALCDDGDLRRNKTIFSSLSSLSSI